MRQILTIKRSKNPKRICVDKLKIAQERREAKTGGDKQAFGQLKAEFQRESRKDRQAQVDQECRKIEDNNQKVKIRDPLRRIRELKNNFIPRKGAITNRRGKQLFNGEQIKNR